MKRQAFPRFYFLADDELLELLSRCRETNAVQPHLQKCFDAIHSLDFGDGPSSNTINAMVRGSRGGRILHLYTYTELILLQLGHPFPVLFVARCETQLPVHSIAARGRGFVLLSSNRPFTCLGRF